MKIDRTKYLQKLIDAQGNGLIKVITGLRRVGKSYLLFRIFKDYLLTHGVSQQHIIEISFEGIGAEHLREPHALYNFVISKIKKTGKYFVFLDEIQYVDRFTEVLNGFLHLPNIDVYVTGSNSKMLSKDVLTEFRGRGDEIRVYPLTFKEFYVARQGDVYEAMDEYFLYGGLPRVLQLTGSEDKVKYLKSIFAETYFKDLLERHRVTHLDELEDLINVLASGVGSLTNPNKLEKVFASVKKSSITAKTIKNYLEYLEDAFLLSKALRYDVKGKKYINTPLKYYFADVGLRNARLGFRQVENSHLMENIVYNELCYRGYEVDVGVVDVLERNGGGYAQKQTEVDFVVNKGYERKYIQVVYQFGSEDKTVQELRPFKAISDSFEKIVICRTPVVRHKDENGFVVVSLKEFLLHD